jgi:Carboxypeptidase regulatory-like domain/Doubled CXXCH motif (Paired_CXXCH_1)
MPMTNGKLAGTLVLALALALAGCKGETGKDGATGQDGAPGQDGSPGQDGQNAPATGTISGTVTDAAKGDALAGVAVQAKDFGGTLLATATTGANGGYTLASVPVGFVQVTFAAPLYTSPAAVSVGTIAGSSVTINAALSEAAAGKPSVTLAGVAQGVGYGATVSLTATASDPNDAAGSLTFTWSDGTVPKFAGVTVTKDALDPTKATVLMPTMANAFAPRLDVANNIDIPGYQLEDRFGIIPIVHDVRGRVTAKVTVVDGRGQSASASVNIDAASVNTGMPSVPTGTRVYLNSGRAGASAWTLSTKPAGSAAALDDATSRTPSFVADLDGRYVVNEGARSLTIEVGKFAGALDGTQNVPTVKAACLGCHNDTVAPNKFTSWLATPHAGIFTEGINGGSGTTSGSCMECHTAGYDPAAASGGFDDVASTLGWTFPAPAAGKWNDVPAELKQLANIQCENCHGPQGANHTATEVLGNSRSLLSPRISYSAEMCGTCHGRTSHHKYAEWATLGPDGIGHSNRAGAKLGAGATGLNASCGRCHVAQGYVTYVGQLKAGTIGSLSATNPAKPLADVTLANAEPVTCAACHDPHDATNPNHLRVFMNTPQLPSGFAVFGAGKGALCATCHNSRNGAQSGSQTLTYLHETGETYNAGNPTGYSAPHQADQSDVFFGRNAYFMAGRLPMVSRHAAVEDTCVGCHMAKNPQTFLSHGAPAAKNHRFRIDKADFGTFCAECHGEGVNGEGIQGQVEAGLAAVASAMGNAVKAKINGFAGGLVRVRAWDEATDFYSSTSASNLVLDVVANPVTSVGIEEVHGQIGFVLHFAQAITVPFVDASGAPAPSRSMTSFAVQMGALKDNQATPVALYSTSGNMVRAGWNYFLIEGDGTEGIHNPSFALAVLAATQAVDLSN